VRKNGETPILIIFIFHAGGVAAALIVAGRLDYSLKFTYGCGHIFS